METKTKHLKFFGIGKILPFLKNVRGQILIMVSLAFISSLVDVTIPQFQRYALDHFVGMGVMDTIVPFIIAYVAVILLASVVNYISCAQATIVEMKVNRELRQTGFFQCSGNILEDGKIKSTDLLYISHILHTGVSFSVIIGGKRNIVALIIADAQLKIVNGVLRSILRICLSS